MYEVIHNFLNTTDCQTLLKKMNPKQHKIDVGQQIYQKIYQKYNNKLTTKKFLDCKLPYCYKTDSTLHKDHVGKNLSTQKTLIVYLKTPQSGSFQLHLPNNEIKEIKVKAGTCIIFAPQLLHKFTTNTPRWILGPMTNYNKIGSSNKFVSTGARAEVEMVQINSNIFSFRNLLIGSSLLIISTFFIKNLSKEKTN